MLAARGITVGPPSGTRNSVIRDFSIELPRGSWVAMTGPNGSGKTSLILALAGLRAPLEGTLELDGRPVSPPERERLRAAVAIVLQETESQLLQSTVAEEIAFAGRNLGAAEEEIAARSRRAAEDLGLCALLDADPRTLSPGVQQLVLIAGALVSGPRFLLLDESGAHLDRENRERLLATLRREVKAGLGTLWVTQEEDELAAADRIVTLDPSCLHVGKWASGRGAPDRGAAEVRSRPFLRLRIAPWSGEPGAHVDLQEGIEIEIPDRGVVALEGRNGTGKSVILSAAAGVLEVDQVRLEWVVPSVPPPLLVAQHPELQLFEEKVEDEILYSALSRGLSRSEALDRASRGLEVLGLDPLDFLVRRSWELSAGLKRILEVVGALIAPASLVALDEPTVGLDGSRRAGLLSLVRARCRKGSVLVASQDRQWLDDLGGHRVVIGGALTTPRQNTD